jgi:hypothetical protein
VTVYVAGAVADQPAAPAVGGVEVVVMRKPVIPVAPRLSLAVNEVIGISLVVAGDVAVNAVTLGVPVSTVTGTGEAKGVDTFPAASFTHG